MQTAWIRAVKEMDERPHPNLNKEIYLNIAVLETDKDLKSLSKKQWKKTVSNVIQKKGMKTYPDRYPFEETEKISVVVADEDNETEEVLTGTLKVPEKYRGTDAKSSEIY